MKCRYCGLLNPPGKPACGQGEPWGCGAPLDERNHESVLQMYSTDTMSRVLASMNTASVAPFFRMHDKAPVVTWYPDGSCRVVR